MDKKYRDGRIGLNSDILLWTVCVRMCACVCQKHPCASPDYATDSRSELGSSVLAYNTKGITQMFLKGTLILTVHSSVNSRCFLITCVSFSFLSCKMICVRLLGELMWGAENSSWTMTPAQGLLAPSLTSLTSSPHAMGYHLLDALTHASTWDRLTGLEWSFSLSVHRIWRWSYRR